MEVTSVGAMSTRGKARTKGGTRMCKGHPGGEEAGYQGIREIAGTGHIMSHLNATAKPLLES